MLPFRPTDKIDIVNVDFVADAIATLHQKERAAITTPIIFLREGIRRRSAKLRTALAAAQQKRAPIFRAVSRKAVFGPVNALANRKGTSRPQRFADESIHAISGLEHGLRQHVG